MKIRDGLLTVPKVGRLRLKDHGTRQPCEHCAAKTVRIRRDGTKPHPKWYAYATYAVPPALLAAGPETGALGVDRNVGQCTDRDGQPHARPATAVENAKIKRYQRKWHRQQKGSHRRRDTATHTVSRKLADKAHTVVLEDLDMKAMTRSAKGMVEEPGRNLKQKAGLNRAILATGWRQRERKRAYKAGRIVKVPAAHTSQTCSGCGHVDPRNRPSQARFRGLRCSWALNTNHNAAVNILGRYGASVPARSARGTGASARRGAFPSGTPTTREQGSRGPSP